MKLIFVDKALIALLGTAIAYIAICAVHDRKRLAQQRDLAQKLKEARQARERWERDHLYQPYLFNNPDYQDLWLTELGAADMYDQLTGLQPAFRDRCEYEEKRRQALA